MIKLVFKMATEINTREEFDKAISYDGLVLIDFHAIWCPPCKAISPTIDKFAQDYPKAKIIKVDVDKLADVAKEYSVSAMPTFIYKKEHKQIDKVVGADQNKIKHLIEKYI